LNFVLYNNLKSYWSANQIAQFPFCVANFSLLLFVLLLWSDTPAKSQGKTEIWHVQDWHETGNFWN